MVSVIRRLGGDVASVVNDCWRKSKAVFPLEPTPIMMVTIDARTITYRIHATIGVFH
jgi:hypothetical protein